MARLTVDGRLVGIIVEPAFSERDHVVDLIGTRQVAHMTDAVISAHHSSC
jgi:hypothetical protein